MDTGPQDNFLIKTLFANTKEFDVRMKVAFIAWETNLAAVMPLRGSKEVDEFIKIHQLFIDNNVLLYRDDEQLTLICKKRLDPRIFRPQTYIEACLNVPFYLELFKSFTK